MEPKSSAWLPQVQGIAIREAALVCKTISTLSITHGGHRSSSPGSILSALPSPGQQQLGCIQPLPGSQPELSLPKAAFAPMHALRPVARAPQPLSKDDAALRMWA